MDSVVCISNDTTPIESDEHLETNHDKKNMTRLPPRAQRYLWLRYQVEGYTEEIEMGQALTGRMRMVYTGDEGHVLFTSHAWRRLFEIQGPLLGEARRTMTWRQFILDLGLQTVEEMAEDGFEAYWLGSTRVIPNKGDPVRRLCHRLISFNISGRAQVPEKLTATDLFNLRSMDEGTTNVPHLLV
ncbi:hypothetical protein Tco_1001454 [Tanacetum coccineum]